MKMVVQMIMEDSNMTAIRNLTGLLFWLAKGPRPEKREPACK